MKLPFLSNPKNISQAYLPRLTCRIHRPPTIDVRAGGVFNGGRERGDRANPEVVKGFQLALVCPQLSENSRPPELYSTGKLAAPWKHTEDSRGDGRPRCAARVGQLNGDPAKWLWMRALC